MCFRLRAKLAQFRSRLRAVHLRSRLRGVAIFVHYSALACVAWPCGGLFFVEIFKVSSRLRAGPNLALRMTRLIMIIITIMVMIIITIMVMIIIIIIIII